MAVSKSTLRVIAVDRLGQFFNQQQLQLRYTPRKLAVHPDHKVLLIAEADAQTPPLKDRAAADGSDADAAPDAAGPESDETAAAAADQLGAPRGEEGQWASCVRVVDPATLRTTHCLELDNNEAALSLALVTFEAAPEEGALLCVGTAKGLRFNPRSDEGGFVRVYKLSANGQKLELLHATDVGGVPRALAEFRGRLLVGVGGALRLYEDMRSAEVEMDTVAYATLLAALRSKPLAAAKVWRDILRAGLRPETPTATTYKSIINCCYTRRCCPLS